jgi:hypothetical protein
MTIVMITHNLVWWFPVVLGFTRVITYELEFLVVLRNLDFQTHCQLISQQLLGSGERQILPSKVPVAVVVDPIFESHRV